jgi:hypothetical protein
MLTYKVELANKIGRKGAAVGNLFGVARYIDGCRNAWVLEPQPIHAVARDFRDYLFHHPEFRPLAIDKRGGRLDSIR